MWKTKKRQLWKILHKNDDCKICFGLTLVDLSQPHYLHLLGQHHGGIIRSVWADTSEVGSHGGARSVLSPHTQFLWGRADRHSDHCQSLAKRVEKCGCAFSFCQATSFSLAGTHSISSQQQAFSQNPNHEVSAVGDPGMFQVCLDLVPRCHYVHPSCLGFMNFNEALCRENKKSAQHRAAASGTVIASVLSGANQMGPAFSRMPSFDKMQSKFQMLCHLQ